MVTTDTLDYRDTLLTYFWIYGPGRERPCPMCTNFLGSASGNANDIKQRVAFEILGRSPVGRQYAFAQERGWRDLSFVQPVGDEYANDLGLINDDGSENPALVVYQTDGDQVRLFYRAEMPMESADPGQDPRTVPDIGAVCNILDLTPKRRGVDWYPKLSY